MPATPRILVLTAGASRRLGQPKALVDLPGGAPVVRLVQAALEASAASGNAEAPLVVTGCHHVEIRAALAAGLGQGFVEGLMVHNTAWEAGRTGGLALAASLAPGRDLCILPVDHPRIGARLLLELFGEWRRRGAPERGWLAPGFGEVPGSEAGLRPGHPIVIGAKLAAELQELTADQPLRDLRRRADPLWMLPTQDPAVLENLDRPGDLEQIRRADRGH
ncbi:MAG: NTP transferase domain-containing protein [Planctomycetota bacterium]|nr:NTP transferase domain-containing protein [Planctomycetota bacterium]